MTNHHNLTLNAQYTLYLMIEERLERREGWDYQAVPSFPPLDTLKAYTFLGSWAWSQPHTKYRWMKENVIYNYGAGYVTPSDIARDYLSVKYGHKPLRCNSLQHDALIKTRKSQPIYAMPSILEHAYYLDLKSAYWQILMAGGWDVEYLPHGFLAYRSDVRDFPVPNHKLARNCLVSMGLPSTMTCWHPEHGLIRNQGGKKQVNLVLWGFVMDVLHNFAHDMIERCNAHYVNTDGYIVEEQFIREAFNIADEWGLVLGIKEQGRAVIRGAGDYDIGSHKSKRPRRLPLKHEYILPRAIDWMRPRFKYMSDRINLDLKHEQLFTSL